MEYHYSYKNAIAEKREQSRHNIKRMSMKRNKHLLILIVVITFFSGCENEITHPYHHPFNGRTTAVFNPDKEYGMVRDIDGNEYKTIVIGNQTWMAENLRVTHYRNGDPIPNVTGNDEWSKLTTGAYCNYNNTTNPDTIATYGRLYNLHAVASFSGLAPEGWRVSTVEDWDILVNYLGGYRLAGRKLKEAGSYHWNPQNEANNSSGFTALPGGWRFFTGDYDVFGDDGIWWITGGYGLHRQLTYGYTNVMVGYSWIKNGYSVRCIKE